MSVHLVGLLLLTFVPSVFATDPPIPLRSTERRYEVERNESGDAIRGSLRGVRTEHRDTRGRLLRWVEHSADGIPELTWVGVYLTDGLAPDRAAYWSGVDSIPFPELCVTSADGRIQDVLYGNPGEKSRRQMRQYFDEAGRELYQEYFAPRSQRKYSEETYRYDANGNELARTWRRLDGRAQRATTFEILETNTHEHWTRRLVHLDGALDAIDERVIEYGTTSRPHPPATSGPVEPSSVILPIPFAPGIVSARDTGENALTFTPDGRTVLFTRYDDDWQTQRASFSVWRDGSWREPEPVPFVETMYNAALSEDGRRIVYCERDDTLAGGRMFVTTRIDDGGWSEPVDLTTRDAVMGSYFRLLADGTLYFHREGDLYRGVLDGESVRDVVPLGAPINTSDGVEFGAWIDPDEGRIIFARGADTPTASGVFVAFRSGESWTRPRRLPIPYGWSIVLSPDGEDLVYVVDDDIVRIPTVLLATWLDAPIDAAEDDL